MLEFVSYDKGGYIMFTIKRYLKSGFIALYQNGEAIRPEHTPARLIIPGWEGSTHVKWLEDCFRNSPVFSRNETSRYTDLTLWQSCAVYFKMESVNNSKPSAGQRITRKSFYLVWLVRNILY